MAKLPVVAIIGRPNTGKSTLFNRLIGQRKAIVSTVAGTTRDHVSHRIDSDDASYLLLDTGGIGATRDKEFESDVTRQSLLALENADLILLTVNSKEPLTLDDRKLLDLLRKKRKRHACVPERRSPNTHGGTSACRHVPVITVLTKADNPATEDEVKADFQEMNVGEEFLAVSAVHRLGIEELEQVIGRELKKLGFAPAASGEQAAAGPPKIAIVGRPNVGKSSIVNALMSDTQREASPLIVSPIAGTTRDAVDTEVRFNDKPYILVDTAGLKKRSQAKEELEVYSMLRTLTAIEQSDLVILVLDALEPLTRQDKRIAALTIQSGKGLLILLNKIDGLRGEDRRKKLDETSILLSFCRFTRIVPCSAKTREGLLKIFDLIELIGRNRLRRIPTRELRDWFEQTIHGRPTGEITRSKHITQASDIPPTFVLFVKQPKRVKVSELRFLENRMRETFGFEGVPLRWITKASGTSVNS